MTCPHGFAKPTMCVSCMEDGPVIEPARWRKVGTPFPARYEGVCADGSCGAQLAVGVVVQRWDRGDERTAYTHEACCP